MRDASFPDLRAFLDRLRQDGDLAVVDVPVDARLEVAEIHRRVIAAGGPALLFTQVAGADHRLAMNLFGTRRRAELAFGTRPRRLIERLVELLPNLLPPTPAKVWGARDLVPELFRVGLRRQTSGPGHRGRDQRRPPGPAPRHQELAGGRRPLPHACPWC